MKKNVLMIVNPVSGAIDKTKFIDAAKLYAAKENLNLIFYTTSGIDDVIQIKNHYEVYKPERIIIVGGDGTIKMVAEAMNLKADTIKKRRAHIYEKLQVENLPELLDKYSSALER